MTYRGCVHNGTVVFDAEPPPDGTKVVVMPVCECLGRGSAAAIFASDPTWHGEISEMEELLRQVQEMRDADIPGEDK